MGDGADMALDEVFDIIELNDAYITGMIDDEEAEGYGIGRDPESVISSRTLYYQNFCKIVKQTPKAWLLAVYKKGEAKVVCESWFPKSHVVQAVSISYGPFKDCGTFLIPMWLWSRKMKDKEVYDRGPQPYDSDFSLAGSVLKTITDLVPLDELDDRER